MADNNFLDKGIEIVKQATEADKKKDYEEAFKLYNQALKYFMTALKYEKNQSYKETIRAKAEEYMKRAEELKAHLESAKGKKTAAAEGGKGDPDTDEIAKFRSDLQGTILNKSPNVRWDDVAGLDRAKEMLKEAVILPMKFPQMFRGKRKPWKGILLYGPPGTGKSYLAKAVATEAEATFFAVGNADLVSKWLGEGEKMVKALFQLARQHAPSIIFIDEVDSMMASRSDKASETANRMLNTFLTEMDGITEEEDKRVLVLGATNIPWTLDAAVLRRFQKRIFIDLPDCNARQRIFELHIGDTPHTLTREDFRSLALQTEKYSGADIATLVQDALMQPIRKVQDATHFKLVVGPDRDNPSVQRQYLTPCSPGDVNGREMTWMDVQSDMLLEPAVTVRDFEKSLSSSRASLKVEDVKKCQEFTNEYGMDGI